MYAAVVRQTRPATNRSIATLVAHVAARASMMSHVCCRRGGSTPSPPMAFTTPPAPAPAASWRLATAAANGQRRHAEHSCRGWLSCSASAGAGSAAVSTLLSLPLFPLPTVAAPAQSGTLIGEHGGAAAVGCTPALQRVRRINDVAVGHCQRFSCGHPEEYTPPLGPKQSFRQHHTR